MPSVPQGELPRPKSWEEFEDIVWDIFRRIWQDPHATRYERSGQRQQGVDIYGQPHYLNGRYAGIQCKREAVGELTRNVVEAETAKAEAFRPSLAEYLIATSDARDARLQESVRILNEQRSSEGLFRVDIAFWEDVEGHLTDPANCDLLQKHYGDWIHRFRPEADGQVPGYEADIWLELVEYGFGRSFGTRRAPFRDIPASPNGFDKQGLPDWGTLWARTRFKNVGLEKGEPVVVVDRSQLELPLLFNENQTSLEFFPPTTVRGRDEVGAHFFFDVLFTEREPSAFARKLKELVSSGQRYRVVLRYHAHSVDGNSEPRELEIAGDFRELYRSVIEYWTDYRFPHLVDLARLDGLEAV